eukprot:1107040-Pyramimonas_sp.AAC.1
MKLMRLPRARHIDAAAISEQFPRGAVTLQCERAQSEVADIGAKRFADLAAWVRVLYLVNIVTPKFWKVNRYQVYLASMFTDGLPLKPAGILRPRIGLVAAVRPGGIVKRKKMHAKKLVTEGLPVTSVPIKHASTAKTPKVDAVVATGKGTDATPGAAGS